MAGPNVRIPCDMLAGPAAVQASAVNFYRSQLPLNPSWFTGSAIRAYLEVTYVNNYGSNLTLDLRYTTTINNFTSSTLVTQFTLTNQGNTNVVFLRSSDIWSSLYNGLGYYYLATPAGGTAAYLRNMRIVIEVDDATVLAIPITLTQTGSSTGAADTIAQIRQTASATYGTETNSDVSTVMCSHHWKYTASEWSDIASYEIDYIAYSNSTSSSREAMVALGTVGSSSALSGTEQTATLDVSSPRLYRITGLSSSLFTDGSTYQAKCKNENASYIGKLSIARLWVKLSNANGLSNFPIYEMVAGSGSGTSASTLEGTKAKYESSKWSSTSGTQTMTRYFEMTFAQDTASPQSAMELVDDDSTTGSTYNTSITNTPITPTASSTYNVDPCRIRSSAFTFPNDNYYYYVRRLACTTSTYYVGGYLVHQVSWAGSTPRTADTPGSATVLQPRTSDVPGSAAVLQPRTSDVPGSATVVQGSTPHTSDVAGSATVRKAGTADTQGSATILQPRTSDVAGSAGVASPKTADTQGSAAVRQARTADVSASAAVLQARTADVSGSATVRQPRTSDVGSSATVSQPRTSDVPSSAGVASPKTADTPGTAAVRQARTTDVQGSAAVQQPRTADTQGSATVRKAGVADTQGSATVLAPRTSDVPSSAGIASPKTSDVPGTAAVQQQRTSDVSGSATIDQAAGARTADTPSSASILQNRTSDVGASAAVRWQRTGDLPSSATIRWARTSDVAGSAAVRWQRTGDLPSSATVVLARSSDVSGAAAVRAARISDVSGSATVNSSVTARTAIVSGSASIATLHGGVKATPVHPPLYFERLHVGLRR